MAGRLLPREDDWYLWRQDPPLAADVLVRVTPDATGRLALTELRIVGPPSADLLRSIPVGRIEAAANAQLVSVDSTVPASPHARRRDGAPARLAHRTDARSRPDAFYETVARAYRALAQSTRRPAVELAAANDVPVTTVHRWIKEARRRGFLAPGRPGKAG